MKFVRPAVIVLLLVVSGAAPSHAWSVLLPRAGQVGIGMSGGYGGLAKSGSLGDEFGLGGNLDVQLRYRMRYERALGLSFEAQRLKARGRNLGQTAFSPDSDNVARNQLRLTLAGVDLYQYFGTRTRVPRYVNAGAGLAQLNARLENGDTQYPLNGDGFYLSVSGGAEWFVYRSWAITGSAKYSSIFLDQKTNHDIRASVGVMFYAAY